MSCDSILSNSSSIENSVSIQNPQNKKNCFSLLPLEILSIIFNKLNFQSYAISSLVSKEWKKLTLEDLERRDIFRKACLLLGSNREDIKDLIDELKEKIGESYGDLSRTLINWKNVSQDEESEPVCTPYHREINFMIPQLRIGIKLADALFTTKGYDLFDRRNCINRNQEIHMIYRGVHSQIVLHRLGLGNWDLDIIRKQVISLSDESSLLALCDQVLFEFALLNRGSEECVKFFEYILSHIQPHLPPSNRKLHLVRFALTTIRHLCLEEKYEQASNFIEKHFKNDSKIDLISDLIEIAKETIKNLFLKEEYEQASNFIENFIEKHFKNDDQISLFVKEQIEDATREQRFDSAKNQILHCVKNEIVRATMFFHLLTQLCDKDLEKTKQIVNENNEEIANALFIFLTQFASVDNKSWNSLLLFFSLCFPVNDSNLEKLLSPIDRKLQRVDNQVIDKALSCILKNGDGSLFSKTLTQILIKNRQELEKSTLFGKPQE